MLAILCTCAFIQSAVGFADYGDSDKVYDPPKSHHKEHEPHHNEHDPNVLYDHEHGPPKTHYKEPEPHYGPPPTHHKEPETHYGPPQTHYKEPEPHYDPPQTHYKEPEPHYKEPTPHYEEPAPHYDPPKTHYKEPEPHYEEPTPHYDPPKTHYKEPEPHHEPHHKPHHEKPKPHYEAPEPHYEHPKPHPKPHYEPPKPHHKKPALDPHGKGKQCVDVSTYTFPTWVTEDRKCCKTVFKKHTHARTKNVCSDVTSLFCDVWPYTECEMKMYDKTLSGSHWTYKFKPVYTCVKHYEDIVHTKKKPVCSKKPKQVCNSKWKISPSGHKVWDGNSDCKTIYVDDCILKDVPEIIKVEKPLCSVTSKIPFMTIEPKKEIKQVYKMECKVLKKNHCEAHTTKECKDITYTESEEKPHKTCDPTYIKVPKQHMVHRKKCLFMKHDNLDHETYKL